MATVHIGMWTDRISQYLWVFSYDVSSWRKWNQWNASGWQLASCERSETAMTLIDRDARHDKHSTSVSSVRLQATPETLSDILSHPTDRYQLQTPW